MPFSYQELLQRWGPTQAVGPQPVQERVLEREGHWRQSAQGSPTPGSQGCSLWKTSTAQPEGIWAGPSPDPGAHYTACPSCEQDPSQGVISTEGLAPEDPGDGPIRGDFQAEKRDFGVHWGEGC